MFRRLVKYSALATVLAFAVGATPIAHARAVSNIQPRETKCMTLSGRTNDIAIVNLTPVEATGPGTGVLTSGRFFWRPPLASNVSFDVGTVDPNVAFTQIDQQKVACFANVSDAELHLVADHLGTLSKQAFSLAQPNGAPKRVLDTRRGKNIPVSPGGRRCFVAPGQPGDFAVVNLTPVLASAAGHGLLVSSNVKNDPPVAANVNYAPGTIDPNVALAQIGNDNKVCYINSENATVHVVADSMGAIKASAYGPADSSGAPLRVLDTRQNDAIASRGTRCFNVAGQPGDFAVVNLTPVLAAAPGSGQLVSSNVQKNAPLASNVNYGPGTVDPNVAITEIGNDNQVCFINSSAGQVHLVADHLGTIKGSNYKSARNKGRSLRVLDTRKYDNFTHLYGYGPEQLDLSQVGATCPVFRGESGIKRYHRLEISDMTPGDLVRITNYKDLSAEVPRGQRVYETVVFESGIAGFDEEQRITLDTTWTQRIRIEIAYNDPARRSTTWLNVSARCDEVN